MAKEETDHEEEDEGTGTEEGEAPRKGKRLIVVIIVVLALLAAAGGGLYFAGMLPLGGDEAATEESHEDAAEEGGHGESAHGEGTGEKKVAGPVFYDMPEFLINLNTGGRSTSFLKMKVALELPSEEMVQKVQAIEPRITDSINTYLRELRVSDLSGSAGLYRLREELLMRINKSLQPDQVNDVLFKEIIVQ